MELNVDVKHVRAELDKEEWEEDPYDPGRQVRSVYVGSWLSLSPSGKIYAPWANSNVMGCEGCNGKGSTRSGPRRLVKKLQAKDWASRRLAVKRFGFPANWPKYIHAKLKRRSERLMRLRDPSCLLCGGMGSREAFLDEQWRELITAEFEKEGMYYDENGGDILAVESRDFPEETEVESPA